MGLSDPLRVLGPLEVLEEIGEGLWEPGVIPWVRLREVGGKGL